MAEYDPIYPPKKAAEYLGRSTRTLRRLNIARHPMPGTGVSFGYRLSALNAYLDQLASPKARAAKVRKAS